jgi:photosystem II stability/assembly factor-like uncharacterized protein
MLMDLSRSTGRPAARRRGLAVLLAALLVLWPSAGQAHDAASWGGLFRSRDNGATWFQASQGRLIDGALAVAISPTDPTYLLLGTDSSLLSSRNGGLDWDPVALSTEVGPVFAVAFDTDGRRALAATGRGLFRSDDGVGWQAVASPAGANPVRAIVRGAAPGRAYLVGWQGLFRTDDWGGAWDAIDRGLPGALCTALLVAPGSPELLFAVVGGEVWASLDNAHSWQPRQTGLPAGAVQALALDPRPNAALWAGGADRVFRSDDMGATWRMIGQPLTDRDTEIRGLAVGLSGSPLVLSTHRGLYATHDGGDTWTLLADNLPGHLEAGPLVRDPNQPSTLYAGFSLTPCGEKWARAVEGRSAASQVALSELAGAAAFLLLLGLGAAVSLQWLSRSRRQALAKEEAP